MTYKKIIQEKNFKVRLFEFETSKGIAWAYLLLSEANDNKLVKALESETLPNFAKYGHILLSGFGKPSEADKSYITNLPIAEPN